MSTVGLITEYNPFHKGHLYHIEEALKLTGASTVIAVMSGNFVQRGEPAIIDKYARTHSALSHGVSLVAELPVYYACSSAESFAFGSVMTLENLGADFLCFGSECGDITILKNIASVLSDEPPVLSSYIKEFVSKGLSYPLARSRALLKYFKEFPDLLSADTLSITTSVDLYSDLDRILSSPNNILGIEYVKTILKYNLNIKPITIKRVGGGYHDKDLHNSIPSASAIRNMFTDAQTDNRISLLNESLPANVAVQIQEAYGKTFPITTNDFSFLLNTTLKKIIHTDVNKLSEYKDVNTELANRLVNLFTGYDTFNDFCMKLKNKQLTYARISRCLMHIVLEITNDTAKKYDIALPYIRLLGLDEKGRSILSERKKYLKNAKIPLITKVANYQVLLKEDIYAADLYNMVVCNKFRTKITDEFRHGIIFKDNMDSKFEN